MRGCIILIAGKSKDMPDGVKNAIKVNEKRHFYGNFIFS